MQLNHTISALFQFTGAGNAIQPREGPKAEESREHAGFQKIAVRAQRSQAHHLEQLSKRIDQMSAMLARLQQSTPALNSASSVLLERLSGATSQFSYSFSQNENGVVTETFSFSIQYKPAGEASYIEATPTPAPTSTPVKTDPASPVPVAGSVPQAAIAGPAINIASTSPVTDPDGGPEAAATPQSFDERVAQLITFYRIDIAVTVAGEKAVATADGNEAVADEKAPVEAETRDANIYKIDADHVRRVRTGEGDDSLFINADTARRIRTGGGDDNLLIDAGRVSRVNSGSGDDFVDITADKVARISSGSGDDVVNITADSVRRIYTGSGDDTLVINADTITRIHAGAGDDTLNLTADHISRVNAGAGDDKIILDAQDAAIFFGKGGGEDVIDITSVGALAIRIDGALASSSDGFNIVRGEGSVTLEFASGERLTINNIENADMISVKVGDETIDLHLSEPTIELDMSA